MIIKLRLSLSVLYSLFCVCTCIFAIVNEMISTFANLSSKSHKKDVHIVDILDEIK